MVLFCVSNYFRKSEIQFGSKEKIFKRVNLEILKTSNLTNNNVIISVGKSIIGFYKYLNKILILYFDYNKYLKNFFQCIN